MCEVPAFGNNMSCSVCLLGPCYRSRWTEQVADVPSICSYMLPLTTTSATITTPA
jgi:hypothetical protein